MLPVHLPHISDSDDEEEEPYRPTTLEEKERDISDEVEMMSYDHDRHTIEENVDDDDNDDNDDDGANAAKEDYIHHQLQLRRLQQQLQQHEKALAAHHHHMNHHHLNRHQQQYQQQQQQPQPLQHQQQFYQPYQYHPYPQQHQQQYIRPSQQPPQQSQQPHHHTTIIHHHHDDQTHDDGEFTIELKDSKFLPATSSDNLLDQDNHHNNDHHDHHHDDDNNNNHSNDNNDDDHHHHHYDMDHHHPQHNGRRGGGGDDNDVESLEIPSRHRQQHKHVTLITSDSVSDHPPTAASVHSSDEHPNGCDDLAQQQQQQQQISVDGDNAAVTVDGEQEEDGEDGEEKKKNNTLKSRAAKKWHQFRQKKIFRARSWRRFPKKYLKKWNGVPNQENLYRRPPLPYMALAFFASFIGMAVLAVIHDYAMNNGDRPVHWERLTMMIGSFGASAVLVYGEIKSPLAQPRNVLGGHLFSSIVGVIIKLVLVHTGEAEKWLHPWGCALAVSLAILVMHITRTTHPPGGATSLIAVTSPLYPWYGFQYVFMPVLAGCLIMLTIALVVNNLRPGNSYPLYWI